MRSFDLIFVAWVGLFGLGASCQSNNPLPPPPTTSQTASTESEAPQRIIALGDVHGDFQAFHDALTLAGLVDGELRWVGGDTVLVQTGDVFDRGDDEREIWEALDRLEGEAEAAGGQVIRLNGNHEILQAQGDFRYVTQGGMEDYTEYGTDRYPGRRVAFRPGNEWAMEMAENDIIVVIDGTVFVHGGVLPPHVAYGVERINRETRAWLRGEGAMPIVLTGEDSPVWTRLYSNPLNGGACEVFDEVLELMDAERMVMGHTVQRSGITSACDGRQWRIDVGMAHAYGGRPEVLEIVGDDVRVLR